MRNHILMSVAVCVAASSCSSSSVAPSDKSAVTIRVTKTTCGSGSCTPLRVLAFPANQPHTPGGFWSIDLGVISTAESCIALPLSATFTVTDGSTGKYTTYDWTSADLVSLGTISTSASRIQAAPSTDAFIPTNSSGWSVEVPGGSVKPGAACTP